MVVTGVLENLIQLKWYILEGVNRENKQYFKKTNLLVWNPKGSFMFLQNFQPLGEYQDNESLL